MSWALAQANQYHHTGATDDMAVATLSTVDPAFPDRVSAGVAYRCVSLRARDQVRIQIRSSFDGRKGIQGGIVDEVFLSLLGVSVPVGLYAVALRKNASTLSSFAFATAYTLLARSPNSLVTEGFLTSSDDRDVAIEVRTSSGRLSVLINDHIALTNAATNDYLLSDDTDFPAYPCFGFVSHVHNAVVKDPSRAALIPSRATTVQLKLIVSGGNLYVSENNQRPRFKGLVAGAQNPVSGAYLDGEAFYVDGENAYVYNYSDDEVSKWGPANGDPYWTIATNGALPGAIPDPTDTVNRRAAGSTTATVIASQNKRLYLADNRSLYASRIGDPFDWYTGSLIDGRAFTFDSEIASSTIRSPILNLTPYENDFMLVGCLGEIHLLRGDPLLEGASIQNITRDVGVLGKDATAIGDSGFAWVLTENGLGRINGAVLTDVSGQTLQRDISKPGSEWLDYEPKLVRDIQNSGINIFFSPLVADATVNHYWFDETSQGLFPERYVAQLGPTAVARVNGQVLLGSRNGYIYQYSNETAGDDLMATSDGGTTAITSACPIGLIMDTDGRQLTMVTQSVISLSNDSESVTLKWYVGRTPEDAYSITTPVFTSTVAAGRTVVPTRVGAGAIVPTISATGDWAIDYFHVETLAGGLIPALPRPTVTSTTEDPGSFGSGSGGSIGGGSGPPGGGGGGGDITGGSVVSIGIVESLVSGPYEIIVTFDGDQVFNPEIPAATIPGITPPPGGGGGGSFDFGTNGGFTPNIGPDYVNQL